MDISSYMPPAAVTPPSASSSVKAPATGVDPKLMDSCRQFEGQFFDMMLQEMRKTIPDDPTLGDDSHEQQIFQGMMDDNVAQEMAKHAGPNDLAAQMYRQLAAQRTAAAAGQGAQSHASQPAAASIQPALQPAKPQSLLKKSPGSADNLDDYETANHTDRVTGIRGSR